VHYELWRIFTWYCLNSKNGEVDQMSSLAYVNFLRDCHLIEAGNSPFTRLDTDLFFIKETRMNAHTDALGAVPVRRPPEQSDQNVCLPSPVAQHALRNRINRTMSVQSPMYRMSPTTTASVERAAMTAQTGGARAVIGRFAESESRSQLALPSSPSNLLSPKSISRSPSAPLLAQQRQVLTLTPSSADIVEAGGSYSGAPVSLSGSISKRLGFEAFLAVLMRMAAHQSGDDNRSSMLKLLNDYVLPRAARWGGEDDEDRCLRDVGVQATLSYYRPFLVLVYSLYATTDKSNFMNFLGFQQFCFDFGVTDGSDLSQQEMAVLFLRSKGVSTRSSLLSHTRSRLSLDEFCEAFARCSLLGLSRLYDESPMDLIKGMFMHISQTMKRPRNGDHTRLNFNDARANATHCLHRLFRDLWVRDNRRHYLKPREALDVPEFPEDQLAGMVLYEDERGAMRATDDPRDVLFRVTHQMVSDTPDVEDVIDESTEAFRLIEEAIASCGEQHTVPVGVISPRTLELFQSVGHLLRSASISAVPTEPYAATAVRRASQHMHVQPVVSPRSLSESDSSQPRLIRRNSSLLRAPASNTLAASPRCFVGVPVDVVVRIESLWSDYLAVQSKSQPNNAAGHSACEPLYLQTVDSHDKLLQQHTIMTKLERERSIANYLAGVLPSVQPESTSSLADTASDVTDTSPRPSIGSPRLSTSMSVAHLPSAEFLAMASSPSRMRASASSGALLSTPSKLTTVAEPLDEATAGADGSDDDSTEPPVRGRFSMSNKVATK
jgi:hypothetical protein